MLDWHAEKAREGDVKDSTSLPPYAKRRSGFMRGGLWLNIPRPHATRSH